MTSATGYLLYCLQNNGASVERKIESLNAVVKDAGIQAVFSNEMYEGKLVGTWTADTALEAARALKLHKELDKDWFLGKFELEVERIERIITKYKEGKDG